MIKIVLSTAALSIVTQLAAFPAMAESKSSTLSCIQSLCGNENPILHPFAKSKNLEIKTKAMISSQMERPLKVYMGRVAQRALILDSIHKSLFQKETSLTSEQAAFLQSLLHADRLPLYQSAFVSTPFGIMLNRWKLKEIAPELSNEEIEAIQYLAPVFKLNQFLKNLELIRYEAAIKVLYPKYTVLYGQVTAAVAIEATYKKIQKIAPYFDIIRPKSLVVEKAKKGLVLSPAEQKIMLKHIMDRLRMDVLFSPEIQEVFTSLPLDNSRIITEAQSRYQQSKVAKVLKQPQDLKQLFYQGIDTCLNDFAYSYAAFPSQAQLTTFKQLFEEVVRKARNLIEQENGGPVESKIRPEVHYPTAKENIIAEWQEGFDKAVVDLSNSLDKIKTLNFDNEEARQSLIVHYGLPQSEILFDEVLSFCKQAVPPSLKDSAIGGTSIINISWPTVVYPEFGLSTIAHELGHVANSKHPQLFSSEGMCLADKQQSLQYATEDFADLFAAEIFKAVNGKIKTTKLTNMACGILSRDEKGWQEGTLENPIAHDTHSSSFYRLLALAKMTDTMTKECTAYLGETKNTHFSEYCKWQK